MARAIYKSKRKWTDQQLTEAIAECKSMAQVGRLLGQKSPSAANRTIPRHIKRLGLDISHFTGRGESGNRTTVRYNKWDLDQILVVDSPYAGGGSSLKRRLLGLELLSPACYCCGIFEWNNKKLTLQIDHINGVNNDNRLENLRLLCPNCHSQTDTYAGKNARKNKEGKYHGEL